MSHLSNHAYMKSNSTTSLEHRKHRTIHVAYAREVTATTEEFQSILDAAKAGAEWAWARLYRDLAGTVTGYLRSRGGTDPEDLASETFLQISRNIESFDGDYQSFRSWVFVIAHRRLLDSRRASGRQPKTVSDEAHLSVVADGQLVDEEAIGRMSTRNIEALFAGLTEDQRDVLALRVIADLTVEQTAHTLGKGVGAVKALQRRALASLKRSLAEPGVTL
jgi:RNA polymerase sigma factor (sigma-70 family)